VSFVNSLLRPLFDVFLLPFSGLPAWVGLTVISVLTAVAMLLIFKATSNQKKLEQVKRQIHAGLFEIRLFNDDLRAILRAQTEILRNNLTYVRLSLVPMVWMIVPLVLVIAQLQFHYGYHGPEPGETTLVKVRLKEGWKRDPSLAAAAASVKPEIGLETTPGIHVETPAVWIPAQNECAWRVAVEEWGEHEIRVTLGGETYVKTARVSPTLARLSPFRLQRGFVNQLLYPAEDPLPASSPLESITFDYPDADVSILGLDLHWMIVFFVLSIVFAFALRGLFGVTI
jgi:hypothetical protein